MNSPIRVAVTGAAGNIGYALIFRIANGDLFGPEQPVILQLLEITPAMDALEAVAMEMDDCAFPLLTDIVLTDDANQVFSDANWAFLVGARPRGAGMERKDLLGVNGQIFKPQGEALNKSAASDIRVLVVGNPANTNCLIAMNNAPDIPTERFTAMTRLDHNRAVTQLAKKAGVSVADVTNMTIWGNHSNTQYPDAFHAQINGKPAEEVIGDDPWIRETFVPMIQTRGATVIQARGASSAASAASAAINHVQTWHNGTQPTNWTSMGIPSTGIYSSPEGLIFSYPVTVSDGNIQIVEGLRLSEFDQEKIDVTSTELLEERSAIEDMLKA